MNPELTHREEQVLKLLLAGYRPGEICEGLHIKPTTLGIHRRNIMYKWGVYNTVELVVESIRRGYLDVDSLPAPRSQPPKPNQ